VPVEHVEIPVSKLSPGAKRVVDRAIEESRRRDHGLITSAHLFCAFALAEWDLFAQTLRDGGTSPHDVLEAVERRLQRVPVAVGGKLRVCPTTALVCSTALYYAGRSGRQAVEASDLLIGLFGETSGPVAASLLQQGADPVALIARLETAIKDR